MKINLRWLVQALSFIGAIYFFIRIWEKSKLMLLESSTSDFVTVFVYALLFTVCFFMMGLTSYLKQKNNGTLKNQVAFFEKVLAKAGLT